MANRVVANMICGGNTWAVYGCGFTICISCEGNVYSFGKQSDGAHGQEEELVFPPKINPSLKHIKMISCGDLHSVCLDHDGVVFSFGCNELGQLGMGKPVDELEFTYVPQRIDLPPIKQISCGYNFSICLSENGELYSFGGNYFGQLGNGETEDSNFPQKITSLKDVDFIECGGDHAICKTLNNNDIYVWGCNEQGQLGIGNTEDKNKPFKGLTFTDKIVDVKCGISHSLILTENQIVYSCGYNFNGQVGRCTDISTDYSTEFIQIPTLSEIIRIECGYYHSFCIDIYNNVFVFGSNVYGQLGVDDTDIIIRVPKKHPTLSNIIDISSKGFHTFVKTTANEIYGFGNNNYSQLGIHNGKKNQVIPIQVLKDNENLWYSNVNQKSRAKSARSVSQRGISPPLKKQKTK